MPKARLGIVATVVLSTLLAGRIDADAQHQSVQFVPDVIGQFNALTRRPDAMGFHIGDGPDPSTCRHHQAVIRTEAPDGTPYFIVSRSGPPRDFCKEEVIPPAEGDPTANLYIVRMGSRDKNGERLRSNRLRRDVQTTFTPPDPRDRVVRSIMYDGTAEWPHYDHPGGMQQVGNIVALGVEFPFRVLVQTNPPVWVQEDPDANPVLVQFLDVTDPENPQLRSTFEPTEPDVKAGVVALTPCSDNRVDPPCATGHYLLAISGGSSNEFVHFYESTGSDLGSAELSWTLLDTWHRDELVRGDGGEWHAHQTLQFLREGNPSGALYLAGARGSRSSIPPFDFGPDFMDLYRVDLDLEGNEVRITWVSSRRMISHPAWEGESAGARLASFAAASGFHVTPSGELLFYAAEHDNDGPEGSNDRGSVKMGEWRHVDTVRPDSPTLAPTVEPGGPYLVNEGATVLMTGIAKPPITKAWIQLFEDPDYRNRYLVVDYDDRAADNFEDFRRLDPGFQSDVNGASDEASSWSWFAPVGCTIRANDDDFEDSAEDPGVDTRTLAGTGQVERNPDLHDVDNDTGTGDVNDSFTSVQFFADCDAYYSSPISVVWDLDLDGAPETAGAAVSFFAEEGPADVHVPVQARHPLDGRTGSATAAVAVHNVAPSIQSWGAFDAMGRAIGSEVPFVVQGRPITAHGTFSDPGRLDRQTASADWADGAVDTVFDVFNDAFGGIQGQLEDRHVYQVAGAYDIALTITDDDLAATEAVTHVVVASPTQATAAIIDLLDALIASTGDPEARRLLIQARKALAGDVTDLGSSGALHKLEEAQTAAALAHLRSALEDLSRARLAGVDATVLIGLVEEVIAAVSFGS